MGSRTRSSLRRLSLRTDFASMRKSFNKITNKRKAHRYPQTSVGFSLLKFREIRVILEEFRLLEYTTNISGTMPMGRPLILNYRS